MKNFIRICLVLVLVFLLSLTLQAQEHYAKLEKNRNIQAAGLIHKLNKTKDTLILQSNKKISYLYAINKDFGRDFDFYIDTTAYKLPLNKLPIGKHVLVAVQSPKRIVFVVRILKEIPKERPAKIVVGKPVATRSSEVMAAGNKI